LRNRAGDGFVKKTLIAGATVVALLIAAVIALPTFVDLGRFKSVYLPRLEETLQRRVDLGEARLTLLPRPSIKVSQLKISAGLSLSAEDFFTAQELQLRLKLWPLLRGRFEIIELVVEKPVLTLQTTSAPRPSYTDLTGKKSPPAESNTMRPAPKQPGSDAVGLTIPRRLRIKDGQLNIITAKPTPLRIHGIELSMEEFSSERPFPYRATFNYPGLKTVTLT
jgi:AsmA protein